MFPGLSPTQSCRHPSPPFPLGIFRRRAPALTDEPHTHATRGCDWCSELCGSGARVVGSPTNNSGEDVCAPVRRSLQRCSHADVWRHREACGLWTLQAGGLVRPKGGGSGTWCCHAPRVGPKSGLADRTTKRQCLHLKSRCVVLWDNHSTGQL